MCLLIAGSTTNTLLTAVRELKELAEAMEVNVGKHTRADGTRWVPHFSRAIEVWVQRTTK